MEKAELFGLALLLMMISIIVVESAPKPKDPEQQQQLLEIHEGIMHFFDAENLAKEIAPDPSLRWSHALVDTHTGCKLLGNGVWYASGSIEGPPEVLPKPPTWEVYFMPEEQRPLFIRVGNLGSGDLEVARQAVGTPDANPNGARR